MKRYEDPNDPNNGPRHLSGRRCAGLDATCSNPAGTAWSPFWCQACNAARMNRIGAFLEAEAGRYDFPTTPKDPTCPPNPPSTAATTSPASPCKP